MLNFVSSLTLKEVLIPRQYCGLAVKIIVNVCEERFVHVQLHHRSKVPEHPSKESDLGRQEVQIDKKTVQLLERLSLVDLDGELALKTLCKSIEFAKRIECIDIGSKTPLYTVLENEHIQLRADIITEGNCREEILKNAKITEEDYFISPTGNIPLNQEDTNINY